MNTAAILGAGAIGGYLIWGLSEKLGDNLWIVADGERKQRLETQGIEINGKQYTLHVRTPQEARGVDVLFVATKSQALEAALDDIAAVVDAHTVVISLMNGVTSEEIIGNRIGKEHVLYATIRIASERNGNRIQFYGHNTPGIFYGEVDSQEPTERMLAVKELLDGTPLHHTMLEDILHEQWDKLALNISCNLVQAILGVGMGVYTDSEHAAFLSKQLREEVVKIAAAKGVDISTPTVMLGGKKKVAQKWARYSTLQDLDAGRHTEIDLFAGAIVEMGRELGIPTPYNAFAYHAIKALEQKNDGLFDYQS